MDKNIKKGLQLLCGNTINMVFDINNGFGPIGNIFIYSIRLFFSIKTGNEFDYELFITNINDIGNYGYSF